ncbi:DMT family transporter [Umezawaea sp.]|uniref:DMT family transporter n=1 Tax=Umezawaea sp. TaxID=1955258 RepID=UPI002ED3C6D0
MARTAALGAAAGGALLWGTIGPVATVFTSAELLPAGGARLAVGALALLALGGRPFTRAWRRRDVGPLLAGAVGLAGFQLSYFAAVDAGGVAVSTAVAIGLAPVLTGLWTAVVDRRLPSRWWLAGTALAAVGLCLLTVAGGEAVTLSPTGLALSTVAAACFSTQALAIRRLTDHHRGTTALAALFTAAALLLLPVTLATATPTLLSGRAAVSLLYLGIVAAGIAYWLFAHGIRHLGAPAAVTVSLLEPAGAAAIAAVVLHEPVGPAQWLGIALVCGAIVLTALSDFHPNAVPDHLDDDRHPAHSGSAVRRGRRGLS